MTVSQATRAAISASAAGMPWSDEGDLADTERGFVARSDQRQVRAADGRVVWDLDAYRFLDQDCPDTAHPSLWRQGQLLVRDGLFEVCPGVYQVRGYDLSVMSLIETAGGVVVVDPLISSETAVAAFALYSEHRGDRPVVGMLYTHSHVDHFGGAAGIITDEDATSGRVPVLAPHGFLEHAVAENVVAGAAMTRRAGYMYGAALPRNPAGQIGAGLGQTTSTGTVSLIAPTVDVVRTGQEIAVDGVTFVFQLTPGTEAPAEMNFHLPHVRALCTAENTSHTLHNIVTLRGAQVRDALAWSPYLSETIDLFGGDLDLVLASHHWPTWGRERAVEFLSQQRDTYQYLHDQTVRLMNRGYVGAEIAESLAMPPALEAAWHTHGYYGSVSHNVKAVYQRYLGWYDGNPAHLWQHPPVAAAQRYVRAMGGSGAALGIAREAYDEGDYRWAAEVLDHIINADADNAEARDPQARALEQVAFGCENGTWRNAFLAGAHKLPEGVFGTPISTAGFTSGLSVAHVLTSLAVHVDGPRAWDVRVTLGWRFPDVDESWVTDLRNGAMVSRRVQELPVGAMTLTLSRLTFIGVVTGQLGLDAVMADGSVVIDGDPGDLARLLGVLAEDDPDFPIVTPRTPPG